MPRWMPANTWCWLIQLPQALHELNIEDLLASNCNFYKKHMFFYDRIFIHFKC